MADILIIDDDRDVCNFLELVLQRCLAGDYEIQTYTDVWSALNYASATPPLIVSCDYVNVGIDGLEVASILRNDPRTSPCRFLLVTARYESSFAAQVLMDDNVDDYLVKPLLFRDYSRAVRTQLEIISSLHDLAFLLLDEMTFAERLEETIRDPCQWSFLSVDAHGFYNLSQRRGFGATVRSAIATCGTPEDFSGILDEESVGVVTFSRSPELICKQLTTEWNEVNVKSIR